MRGNILARHLQVGHIHTWVPQETLEEVERTMVPAAGKQARLLLEKTCLVLESKSGYRATQCSLLLNDSEKALFIMFYANTYRVGQLLMPVWLSILSAMCKFEVICK